MTWLSTVALAAGVTAIIVTAYILTQRWHRQFLDMIWSNWEARRNRTDSVASARQGQPAAQERPVARVGPAVSGLAAYRTIQDAVPQHPDRFADAGPGLEALDGLLRRLRQAADSLEEIALKSSRVSGANVGYESFVTGMDVEYLHRQN